MRKLIENDLTITSSTGFSQSGNPKVLLLNVWLLIYKAFLHCLVNISNAAHFVKDDFLENGSRILINAENGSVNKSV